MKRLLAVVLLGVGCGAGWPTITPTSEQEVAVVHETTLAAARQGVKVVGEITDKTRGTDGRAGWYVAGVAYYYRPIINTLPVTQMRELAVHEVCHATFGRHDTAHWCCMKNEGEVGYPPPVAPGGQWPVCR